MNTATAESYVERVNELLTERYEGKGVQPFLQLARKLDIAVQSGLVKADSTKSAAVTSWEDELIEELDGAGWRLFILMYQIGQLLDEAQQDSPAENLDR